MTPYNGKFFAYVNSILTDALGDQVIADTSIDKWLQEVVYGCKFQYHELDLAIYHSIKHKEEFGFSTPRRPNKVKCHILQHKMEDIPDHMIEDIQNKCNATGYHPVEDGMSWEVDDIKSCYYRIFTEVLVIWGLVQERFGRFDARDQETEIFVKELLPYTTLWGLIRYAY